MIGHVLELSLEQEVMRAMSNELIVSNIGKQNVTMNIM